MVKKVLFLASLVLCASLQADDLAPSLVAKLLGIISSNQAVACRDAEVSQQLLRGGIKVDPGARFAWTRSAKECADYTAQGKTVIVPSASLAASGACVVLTLEGGKPAIYIHVGNLQQRGATLPDAVQKLAKRL